MLESRFENEEQPESVSMTQTEAAEVVKLWAEKQRQEIGRPGFTSVKDVAEGLDIPAEQAQALLDEVRGKREAFRELPVSFPSSPPGSALATVSLFALGLLLIGFLLKAASFSIFAGLILLVALLASRKWGLAALALVAGFILILGTFSYVRQKAPVAISAPAPPEVATPIPSPTPEIPPPAVQPSPQ